MVNKVETHAITSLEIFFSDKKADALELSVIKKYIQKLLKHQISIPPHNSYVNSLTTPELLESFAAFLRLSHRIKKHAPNGFNMPSNKAWAELFMSLHIPDEQAQQSQLLSELAEMYCFNYFCNIMEKHKKSLGELNYHFSLNENCDLYCIDCECTKLDMIFDIYQDNQKQSLNIECKYLSYAFFNELIVKNVFNYENIDLRELCIDLNKSLALMFSHCDPYANYNNSRNSPTQKMMEAFSVLLPHSSKLLPYIPRALNNVASFICNKKSKQLSLFKEGEKNVLFISLMDFTTKHHFFQFPLDIYYNSEDIKPIYITFTEDENLFIDRIIIHYRNNQTYFKNYTLNKVTIDEQNNKVYEFIPLMDNRIYDYVLLKNI